MSLIVNITNITGSSPYDIYICQSGGTGCFYITTITSVPYSFVIPEPYDMSDSYMLKIIDNNDCIISGITTINTPVTPTPTNTPSSTQNTTPTNTPTNTPTPTTPCVPVTYSIEVTNDTIFTGDCFNGNIYIQCADSFFGNCIFTGTSSVATTWTVEEVVGTMSISVIDDFIAVFTPNGAPAQTVYLDCAQETTDNVYIYIKIHSTPDNPIYCSQTFEYIGLLL